MTAGRYTIGGIDLPPSAMVTSGDGETLSYTLFRAVEATEWDRKGDGKAVPQELVITFTVEGGSEADASAQAELIKAAALTATQINRDNRVYRRILGLKSFISQHDYGDGSTQQITMTLLPRESYWRKLDNTGNRTF